MGLDRRSGLEWGGGYVGDGVGSANPAGRTIADLIRGVETEVTRLPRVDQRSRSWDPEPLRWLDINASTRIMSSADQVELRTGRQARRAGWINRLLGH